MDFLFALNGMAEMGWLLQNYGPLLTAVVFFIWRDFRREDKLTTRVNELEEEQRKVILPLVKNCTEVITRSTQAIDLNTKIMERLEHAIDRTFSNK